MNTLIIMVFMFWGGLNLGEGVAYEQCEVEYTVSDGR